MSRPAVIAARNDRDEPDTTEIAALADAAGYDVERELTQVRPPDPATNLGSGKVEELATACQSIDADAAILDVELSPRQTFELGDQLPDGVEVYDRRRLILEIFDAQASTKRARLEIELARLRWELEYRRDQIRRGGIEYQEMQTIRDPEGEYVREVKDRIDEVKRQLQDCPDRLAEQRERRRDAGFDHVALAGYTNAGKSTLLHRLADELDVADAAPETDTVGPQDDSLQDDADTAHGVESGETPADARDGDAGSPVDLGEPTAAAEDRLFKTLETTTRRATVDGRRLLVSDTVGFVSDLPHDLVESFRTTLGEVRHADVVVTVVDATKDPDVLRSRVETVVDVVQSEVGELGDTGEEEETQQQDANTSLVVALNKVDVAADVEEKTDVVESVIPGSPAVVPTSAVTGTGIPDLEEAILTALPSASATLTLPNDGDGQRTLSWLYDHAAVESVDYGDHVEVAISGRPNVVDQARAKAADLG